MVGACAWLLGEYNGDIEKPSEAQFLSGAKVLLSSRSMQAEGQVAGRGKVEKQRNVLTVDGIFATFSFILGRFCLITCRHHIWFYWWNLYRNPSLKPPTPPALVTGFGRSYANTMHLGPLVGKQKQQLHKLLRSDNRDSVFWFDDNSYQNHLISYDLCTYILTYMIHFPALLMCFLTTGSTVPGWELLATTRDHCAPQCWEIEFIPPLQCNAFFSVYNIDHVMQESENVSYWPVNVWWGLKVNLQTKLSSF